MWKSAPMFKSRFRLAPPLVLLATVFAANAAAPPATAALTSRAVKIDAELRSKVLPYWFDTAQDKTNGDYLLADDAIKGRKMPART